MEVQQLKYFLAAAETGGFSSAARRCAVTQPSLSQQIAKLEAELETPLFDRLPRRVRLTEAGRRLQRYARRILDDIEQAKRHVAETPGEVTGRLALGAIPTMAPFILPKVLRSFLRKYPGVELTLFEEVTERLLDRLASGHLDLAVLSMPAQRARILVETLFDEPMLVALRSDHPLARKRRLRWSDLSGERILVLQEMHCLGTQVAGFCQRHRAATDIVFRGDQLATIRELVAQGMGLSMIPQMAANADTSRRRLYRPIHPDPPSRQVVVAALSDRFQTNAARAMIAELRKLGTSLSAN